MIPARPSAAALASPPSQAACARDDQIRGEPLRPRARDIDRDRHRERGGHGARQQKGHLRRGL